jgi:acetyl-CoA acetyltransferase
MALRDAAIVGYAETKIVEKSERDVWELGAEILEALIVKTGFEKGAIDGLILSSSMTGAGNCFWSQTTADQLGLEVDLCQTVDIGGCSPLGAIARAAAAIDAGLCSTVLVSHADTQASENNQRMRAFHNEWTVPLGLLGPPAAAACSAGAMSTSSGSTMPRSASSPWRSAAIPRSTSWRWRNCASRSPSTTISTRA